MNPVVVVAVAATAIASASPAAAESKPKPKPKKDRERAAKSTTHRAPPAAGTRAVPLVNIYNSWTHEWLALAPGERPPQATIERFLRDHYTNQPGKMEPRLIDIVRDAATHFRSDRVLVISGFRHPKYNLLLRKKGHQVARDSQHTHGNAIDFQIPKVATPTLHAWARDQKIGGVGLYLKSGFVHMDTGPIRFWEGE